MLKFKNLVQYRTPEVAKLLQSTSCQMQNVGWPQNFQFLNSYSSADCSILLNLLNKLVRQGWAEVVQ